MFKTQDLYEKHFEKHIVSSCNNPKTDNVKTCRSSFFKKAAPKTQKLINPVRTKKQ
jgi:hypothetical protein